MRRKLDFLFLCEVALREEKCYILLCEELRRRGYKADYILNKDWMFKPYNADVKVLISNCPHDLEFVGKVVYCPSGLVPYFVYVRWEQIYPSEEKLDWEYKENKLCNTAKTFNFFSWGAAFTKILNNANIEKKRIFQVGPVHFDFYRDMFSSMYISKQKLLEEFSLDKNQKLFLFISSFGNSDQEKLSDDYIRACAKDIGEQNVYRIMEYDAQCQSALLEWFDKLLSNTSDWTIVYRPHPGVTETNKLYEFADKHKERFKIILKYGIQEWINSADLLGLIQSTTVSDIFYAKKKCCLLNPIPRPDFSIDHLLDGENVISDYDSFEKSVLSGGSMLRGEGIKKYYDVTDVPSYVRWCDSLEKIYHDGTLKIKWDPKEVDDIAKIAHDAAIKTKVKRIKNLYHIKLVIKFILYKLFRYYNPKTKFGKMLKEKASYIQIKDYELQKRIKEALNLSSPGHATINDS